MDMNKLSLEQIVKYINGELAEGRTMKSIENDDFKVNDRVITKRLTRKGYKRINDEFVCVIQKDNKNIEKIKKEVNKDKAYTEDNIIQKNNGDIDDYKLMELISLIEPIKEMLKDYKKNKNITDIQMKEIKPKAITEVKQKLFKIDINVLKQWEEFVLNHKEYKVQQLISLALEEFIQRYN
ncbi:hypothetical protein KDH02_004811 [Salmonella enterica]|nr:hypothetical protein [Salmonella enterica]EHL2887001.1 hypothetical protein [Salmonella enterica]